MNYLDAGFDPFLARVDQTTQSLQQIDSLAFDQFTPNISGTKVQGGLLTSNDGKVRIDLENNTFIVTDGIAERVRLGVLPDDKIGLLIKDKDGNVLMQISEGLNIIQSANKRLVLDIDNEQFIVSNEGLTPIVILGNLG